MARQAPVAAPACAGDEMDLALPEFLAHAVALEQEAAERYMELAAMMEAHRNDDGS